MSSKLWEASPERKLQSHMSKFMEWVGASTEEELHLFSVQEKEKFWTKIIKYFGVVYSGELEEPFRVDQFLEYNWFPTLNLNFAQNLLEKGSGSRNAIVAYDESGKKTVLSFDELRRKSINLACYLKYDQKIAPGDVVAAYMPNVTETVITMLGAASIGAIFTSTSCDFGAQGVIDRFGQTKPKILITTGSYFYGGKVFDQKSKLKSLIEAVDSIKTVIMIGDNENHEYVSFEKVIENHNNSNEFQFSHFPFSHPLYIMYSSGTTGSPKCIVHSQGGTLLQHVKELGLHVDLKEEDKLLYFTTCGWMMWNWMVSSLFFGTQVNLYEGSPGFPSLSAFLKQIDQSEISIWGTSPKFIQALMQSSSLKIPSFKNLKTILSTGAPLMPEQFQWVYKNIKKDIHLSSISGGTDILGCFMLGSPLKPVFEGELQTAGLGMDVRSFNENGEEVQEGVGELVCLKPFPSTPISFWNDAGNKKFIKAYFSKFAGIWFHGDFIEKTKNQGFIVHGRSDATLNPGGVRIGTAEIYRQTAKLDFIEDDLCCGINIDGECKVVLFVKLVKGLQLSPELIEKTKKQLRIEASPRHVPHFIYDVKGIPYTRSGKKVEITVTKILHGQSPKNLEALKNPEVLSEYRKFREMIK